uniref:Uncharacterized protein n=1 Tax=Oryza punctata TaxID=4537 RepID=A0A0E0M2X0_ORYPU
MANVAGVQPAAGIRLMVVAAVEGKKAGSASTRATFASPPPPGNTAAAGLRLQARNPTSLLHRWLGNEVRTGAAAAAT